MLVCPKHPKGERELNMFPLQSQSISSYYEHVQVCLVNLIYRDRQTQRQRGEGGGETEIDRQTGKITEN